jgi:hypothetical protein
VFPGMERIIRHDPREGCRVNPYHRHRLKQTNQWGIQRDEPGWPQEIELTCSFCGMVHYYLIYWLIERSNYGHLDLVTSHKGTSD